MASYIYYFKHGHGKNILHKVYFSHYQTQKNDKMKISRHIYIWLTPSFMQPPNLVRLSLKVSDVCDKQIIAIQEMVWLGQYQFGSALLSWVYSKQVSRYFVNVETLDLQQMWRMQGRWNHTESNIHLTLSRRYNKGLKDLFNTYLTCVETD